MPTIPRTYAVMGATGHVGSVVADALLKQGHTVRVLGRTRAKLEPWRARGAQAYDTPFHDAAGLSKAFEGASAVFTMIPPAYDADDFAAHQDKTGEATVAALKWARTSHVVDLSSIGAQLPSGTGPIAGLYRQEQRLNGIAGLNVVHLRPGHFMENQLWSIPTIKQRGVNGSPMRGDTPMFTVAARDIGRQAAELLDAFTFRGRTVVELAGPRTYTLKEITGILGRAIGQPDLQYTQVPPDQAKQALVGMGMKPRTADLMLEMEDAFNQHRIAPEREPVKGTTTFEQFAQEFARAYQAA